MELYRFRDWEHFRQGFREEFCPAHTNIAAINHLESVAYFQNKRSVDEYLDKFMDLVTEAGYTDNKTIVVKFCRGLDPHIQDAIATMTSGRPSDKIPSLWYNAARTLDQNRATNDAFRSSYRLPNSGYIPTQARNLFQVFPDSQLMLMSVHHPEILYLWTLMLLSGKPAVLFLAIAAEKLDIL